MYVMEKFELDAGGHARRPSPSPYAGARSGYRSNPSSGIGSHDTA